MAALPGWEQRRTNREGREACKQVAPVWSVELGGCGRGYQEDAFSLGCWAGKRAGGLEQPCILSLSTTPTGARVHLLSVVQGAESTACSSSWGFSCTEPRCLFLNLNSVGLGPRMTPCAFSQRGTCRCMWRTYNKFERSVAVGGVKVQVRVSNTRVTYTGSSHLDQVRHGHGFSVALCGRGAATCWLRAARNHVPHKGTQQPGAHSRVEAPDAAVSTWYQRKGQGENKLLPYVPITATVCVLDAWGHSAQDIQAGGRVCGCNNIQDQGVDSEVHNEVP